MEGFDKSSKNLVALGLSVIVSLISAGNGGGFFYIPLFTDYLLLSIQEASALTSSTLMLGGIPAVCDAIFEKNPLMKDLPLIDFMTVLVVCPGLMFGTSVGVLVSSIVPSYVLILLTGVVFIWGCRSVLFSLIKSYKLDILRIRSSVTLSNPAVITINTGVAVSNASSIHEKGFRQPFLIQILLSIFVAIFIIFEILKSRYQINTLKFLLIQVGQCIFCISFTVAAIRIESRVRQLAIKINELQLNMLWKQNTIVPFVAPLTQENSDTISLRRSIFDSRSICGYARARRFIHYCSNTFVTWIASRGNSRNWQITATHFYSLLVYCFCAGWQNSSVPIFIVWADKFDHNACWNLYEQLYHSKDEIVIILRAFNLSSV